MAGHRTNPSEVFFKIDGRFIKRVNAKAPLTFNQIEKPELLGTSIKINSNQALNKIGSYLGILSRDSKEELMLSDSSNVGFCLSEDDLSVKSHQTIEEENSSCNGVRYSRSVLCKSDLSFQRMKEYVNEDNVIDNSKAMEEFGFSYQRNSNFQFSQTNLKKDTIVKASQNKISFNATRFPKDIYLDRNSDDLKKIEDKKQRDALTNKKTMNIAKKDEPRLKVDNNETDSKPCCSETPSLLYIRQETSKSFIYKKIGVTGRFSKCLHQHLIPMRHRLEPRIFLQYKGKIRVGKVLAGSLPLDEFVETMECPLIYYSDSRNDPKRQSRSRSLKLDQSFYSNGEVKPLDRNTSRRQTIDTNYVPDCRQILLNVRTNVLLINAELTSLGIQTPYRSALETFPTFRGLHLNIKLNINRHTSNLGKQITDDEDSIEKIKIKTDEEDSPKKKIIDNAVHTYDTSHIVNSKVIESLQTLEGKLNDSKGLLGCKESTHICNEKPSKYRNIDEHIDDASFLGNYMYYFIEGDILTPTSLCLFNNYHRELIHHILLHHGRINKNNCSDDSSTKATSHSNSKSSEQSYLDYEKIKGNKNRIISLIENRFIYKKLKRIFIKNK